MAWGVHLAQEALSASAPVQRAFVSEAAQRSAEGRAVAAALSQTAPVLRTSGRVLESIAAGAGDQGILLILKRPSADLAFLLATRPTLLLLAHGIQDPGNLGSMVRTALSLGADAMLALEGCADPFASRAARAAMGALFRLPVVASEAARVLPALRGAGLALVAADVRRGERPDALDLGRPIAIAVGSEARGLPAVILEAAAARARIPMAGGSASLNVHAAAAALLYETMRQRAFVGAL